MVWHAGWLQQCAECWYRKTRPGICLGRAVIAFSAYLEIINLGIRLRNLVGDYNHILLVLWKERIELVFVCFFFFVMCYVWIYEIPHKVEECMLNTTCYI